MKNKSNRSKIWAGIILGFIIGTVIFSSVTYYFASRKGCQKGEVCKKSVL